MIARAAARISVDHEGLRPQIRMAWLTPLFGTFSRKSPAQIMPTGAGMLICKLAQLSRCTATACLRWTCTGDANSCLNGKHPQASIRTTSAKNEPTMAATHTTMIANAEP